MLFGALSLLDCAGASLGTGGEGAQVLGHDFRRGSALQVFSSRVFLVDWGDFGVLYLFVPCTLNSEIGFSDLWRLMMMLIFLKILLRHSTLSEPPAAASLAVWTVIHVPPSSPFR